MCKLNKQSVEKLYRQIIQVTKCEIQYIFSSWILLNHKNSIFIFASKVIEFFFICTKAKSTSQKLFQPFNVNEFKCKVNKREKYFQARCNVTIVYQLFYNNLKVLQISYQCNYNDLSFF